MPSLQFPESTDVSNAVFYLIPTSTPRHIARSFDNQVKLRLPGIALVLLKANFY